jgi:integrase
VGKINFTKRSLEILRPRDKRYNVLDENTRGLGIAVYPSGAKTFFHVKKVMGRPERTTLGSFPDFTVENARGKAGELNGKLARWKSNDYIGPSPLKPHTARVTLTDIFNGYVEQHLKPNAKNKDRAVYAAEWFFKLFGELRTRRADHVRREDIAQFKNRIATDRSQYVANRALQMIRSVFNWAIRAELFSGANPASGLELFHEGKRTRFLQKEEMPMFFAALKEEPNRDLADYLWIALMTGARRGDILSARWCDINLDQGLWTVPNPKAREVYVVALMPEAAKVLRRRKEIYGDEWVFPGNGKSGHLVEVKRSWCAFRSRAGLPDLRLHDLRRSLGSWMASTGASLPVIQKTLGHASFVSTQIYARLNVDSIRADISTATKLMIAASNQKLPQRVLPASKAGRFTESE